MTVEVPSQIDPIIKLLWEIDLSESIWTDLLNAFIDSGGMELIEDDDLINFHRLLICDDMFLMCLIAETKECPPELQGNPLKELQQFASTYIVESRWVKVYDVCFEKYFIRFL